MTTDKKILRRGLTALSLVAALGLSSCTKDLDRFPTNGETSQTIYNSPAKTLQAFAKVYGAFALSGNGGKNEDGNGGDIAGIDEGASDFVRGLFNLQELPTETAICAWGDGGVPDLHAMSWSSSNPIIRGLYYRSIYQIKLASEFLKNTESQASDATVRTYRAEARFLRAYQYWVLIDLFGNPPFVDESTPTGKVYPRQISRSELFNYIESELKAIESDLKTPKAGDYGRADQAAAWALLSRLYLNAEVYTGTERYADAATYAEKVISSGKYSLHSTYANLFLADNNLSNPEIILSVNYDGKKSQNWGGMTFLINSSTGADAKKATGVNMGVNGGWQGNRATKGLPRQRSPQSRTSTKGSMSISSATSPAPVPTVATATSAMLTSPSSVWQSSTSTMLRRLSAVRLIRLRGYSTSISYALVPTALRRGTTPPCLRSTRCSLSVAVSSSGRVTAVRTSFASVSSSPLTTYGLGRLA